MSVVDSINSARTQGATDDQIMSEILKQNPDKASVFQQAQQMGAPASQILNEVLKQNTSSSSDQSQQSPSSSFLGNLGQGLNNAGQSVVGGFGNAAQAALNPSSQGQQAADQGGFIANLLRGVASPARALGQLGGSISNFFTRGTQQQVNQGTQLQNQVEGAAINKLKTLPQDDPRAQSLMSALASNQPSKQIASDVTNQIQGQQITPGQAAGTALEGGATAATFGMGVPAATAPRMLGNAALGGLFGAAQVLQSNQSGSDLTKNVATGAVGGAILPEVVGWAGEKIAGAIQSGAESIVNRTFNRTGKALEQDVVKGDISRTTGVDLPTFAQKYLDGGEFFKGSQTGRDWIRTNVLNANSPTIKGFEQIVNSEVGQAPVPIGDLKDTFDQIISRIDPLAKTNEDVKALQSAMRKVGEDGTMPWKDALSLKRVSNSLQPARAFVGGKLSPENQALQSATGKLADRLVSVAKEVDPDLGTRFEKLNNTYSLFRTAYDGLVKGAAKPSLSFGEKVGGAMGLMGAIANPAEVPALAGLAVGEKVAKGTGVRLGTAFSLNKIANTINPTTVSPLVSNTAKVGLFKALSQGGQRPQLPPQ